MCTGCVVAGKPGEAATEASGGDVAEKADGAAQQAEVKVRTGDRQIPSTSEHPRTDLRRASVAECVACCQAHLSGQGGAPVPLAKPSQGCMCKHL